MHEGRLVFAQLMDFFPRHEFNQCVRRYQGNHWVHHFSRLDQFLAMAFAQLTGREGLRDIENCLRAMGGKLYHAGFRGQVARSTLAVASERRDWRIYADFAYVLIAAARKLHAREDFALELDNTVNTQIWIAISEYVLVAIVKKQLGLDLSTYTILQILSVTLFEKMPILRAFADIDYKNQGDDLFNQL